MIRHITVSYPNIDRDRELDLFPLFLDLDFQNLLPRGVLMKIDLLTMGEVYKIVNKISKPNEIIYVLKNDFCFEKGFFMLDFEKFSMELTKYLDLLSSFEHDCLYFEKNSFIDYELVSEKLNKRIFVTEFI